MNKPLLPPGIYKLKLVRAEYVKGNILQVQCIFEPQDDFKGFQTVSRKISKYSPWADSSRPFIDQLEGFNHDKDILDQIQKYMGQIFLCKVKEGKGWQRNLTTFLDLPANIKGISQASNDSLQGNVP